MMKEYFVNNEQQLCFVVKEGDAVDIVLPMKYLANVDYRRVVGMEERGGELMKVMRETSLENGNNALVQFQTLFVQYKKPKVAQAASEDNPEAKTATTSTDKPAIKRGRGRPAGAKNKKTT